MPSLTNKWVGYLHRSAEQILDNILNRLGSRVPEMSDHSPSNPYVRNLEQFAGIAEQLGYYIDSAAREVYVSTARLYASLIYKAREHDYQVIGNLPFTTDVQFTISQTSPTTVTIPKDTIISNADGSIRYRTLAVATIGIGDLTSNTVGAIQSELVTGYVSVTSDGTPDLEVALEDKIAHNSIAVRWNNVAWQSKDTLSYSSPTDTHFVQTVDQEGRAVIIFGNELPTGKIPVSGQVLELDYEVTLGADGGVGRGELNTVVSTIPSLPSGIAIVANNLEQAVGGSNVESIEDLKRHIPLSNRTLRRAVTEDDFTAIASLAPGVASAQAIFDGRRVINTYIVPIGGGIASTPLIASTQSFIDSRKVVGTNPIVKAAGEVRVELVVDINALPSYSNNLVADAVEDALVDYISYKNQKIKGQIFKSDLYEIIERVPGVSNSDIKKFAISPYACPITPSSPPLVWTKTIVANLQPAQLWQIVFTNSTTFRLVRNATIVGTYTVGNLVTTPQLTFTVASGGYTAGNAYQFHTYPYSPNSIKLLEPSLLVSTASDIVLNVTGGY